MNIMPWRLRALISDRAPLAYHLAVNMFRTRSGEDYWDKNLAEGWEKDDRRWPTKLEILANLISKDAEILDVACGKGSMMRGLREIGFSKISGLEISKYAVNRLREEGFSMFHGMLPNIPVSSQSQDVIIASQVLEHIARRKRFASEVVRVLKPGGHAFIFVPDNCLGPIDEPEHVMKYTKESLKEFLSKHFTILSVESLVDKNYTMPILFAHVST